VKQAVKVLDVSGTLCSPQCASGSCPSDEPRGMGCEFDVQDVKVQDVPGDFCRPMWASGSCPSDVRAKVNGECGEGTCQASMGQLATVGTKSLSAPEVEANPTYYGDPAMGCESDVQDVKAQGVSGTLCSPMWASGSCPSDVRANVNGECGEGTCQASMGQLASHPPLPWSARSRYPEGRIPALRARERFFVWRGRRFQSRV